MKIKNIQIRKALIQNKKLNPFSDNFDKAEVIALLKEIENERENLDDIDLKLINTIKVTFVLNSTFIETFEYLKSIIYDINLSVDEIIDYCLAFVNRNAILVRKMAVDELSSKKDGFNLADSHKFKINSLDDSIGQISAASALESNIDALNILLNFQTIIEILSLHFNFLLDKYSFFENICHHIKRNFPSLFSKLSIKRITSNYLFASIFFQLS